MLPTGVPSVASVGIRLIPDPSGFIPATQAALRSVMAPIGRAGSAVGPLAVVAGSVAAIGAAGVKAAADVSAAWVPFETTLVQMKTLAGESEESVRMLGNAVLDLAPEVGQGPQELADTLQFIASSGFEGASALQVLDATARAAAVGMGDLHSIADAVTSAVNAWGEDTLTAAEATDVLLRAVQAGKADPDELAQSMGRVTGIAADMGVEFHEVAAAVAAMSLTGLDAAEAVTSLRAILTGLLNPTKQAADTLGALGLNASDLRSTLADDRQGLRTVLFDLAEAFGTNEEAAGAVFGNVRALAGVLNLTGAQAETTKSVFDELATGIYSVDDAFAEVAGTQEFRRAAAEAERMAVLIGEGSAAAESLTRLYEAWPALLADVIPELAHIGLGLADLVTRALEWRNALAESRDIAMQIAIGGGPDAGGGQASRSRLDVGPTIDAAAQIVDVLGGVDDAADLTRDQLVALFDAVNDEVRGNQTLMQRLFSTDGMEQVNTLARLGIGFQDIVDIASTGRQTIGSLGAAFNEIAGHDLSNAFFSPDDIRNTGALLERVNLLADALAVADQNARLDTIREWADFRDPIYGLAEAYADSLNPAIAESVEHMELLDGWMGSIPTPSGAVIGGLDTVRNLIGDAALEAQDLSSALLGIASPGFAAADAVEAFNEQYGDVMADGIMTDEERASLLRPFLEVQARIDELDPESAEGFATVVNQAWLELGGSTSDLFGPDGVIPLAIGEFGTVVATIGDQVATNAPGWGPLFGDIMIGELDEGMNQVKDHLGIDSPSTLWDEEVGYQVPAGVAQGIRRGTHLVRSAVDSMMGAIPPPSTVSGGTGTKSGGPSGGGGAVMMNMTVNNPAPEPASTSLQRAGTQALVMLRMARPGVN